MKTLTTAAAALLIVARLNWGLVAVFEFDLVAAVFGLDFGETNVATRVVYGLVGLSAAVLAARLGELGLAVRFTGPRRQPSRGAKANEHSPADGPRRTARRGPARARDGRHRLHRRAARLGARRGRLDGSVPRARRLPRG